MIDKAVVFVANQKSSEAADPRDSAFDFPAASVTSKFAAVLSCGTNPAFTMRTNEIPAFGLQARAQRVAIIGSIRNQRRRFIADRDFFEDSFDQRNLSRRSTFGPACEWNSLTIRHHQPLCTLSALGFSDAVTPFFAGEKLASTNTSSQSKSPCSSSESRKACQMASSTPSPSHSVSRRQHVLGEGYRSGRSRQRAPLRSTHKIPSRQARSSAGGRPPRGERLCSGRKGLIRSHCASVMKTSCRRAIEGTPFDGTDSGTTQSVKA